MKSSSEICPFLKMRVYCYYCSFRNIKVISHHKYSNISKGHKKTAHILTITFIDII